MRARLLLWLSLGLNGLLALMIFYLAREGNGVGNGVARQRAPEAAEIKTNVVVRRHGFHWREVESADFPAYIANLRRIGCPEKTIRDIIVAEVDDLFAEKAAREIQLPEQKWWLPDPEMDVMESAMEQARALELERSQLLAQLLGQDWQEQRATGTASVVRFDGPVLSALPAETKSAVERIEASSRRSEAEALQRAQQEGRSAEGEVARLRQEKRRELAALLNRQQLEEYMLRYSDTAEEMREELRGFGAEPDEFRRIFRARDGYAQQLAALDRSNAAAPERRVELERLRDEAIRQAVGPERFGFYQMSQNPLFRQAQEQAAQIGAPPDKVLPLFRVNQETQAEMARIQADRSITEDQRRVALAMVQQQQQNSIERILGDQPVEEPVQAQVPVAGVPGAAAAGGAGAAAGGPGTTAQQAGAVVQPPPLPPLPTEAFGAPNRTRGPVYERMPSRRR